MEPDEIIALIDAGARLLELARLAIARGRERGEWTAEEERLFAERRAAIMAQPHWLPA